MSSETCLGDDDREGSGQKQVRAQLVPEPFGPNWSLGRSSPILDPGPFGPIGWACPYSRGIGHVPCPGWACPMPRLGMSHAQGGHVPCPGWACPIFVWGPFGSHVGTHFLFGAHFGSRLGTHFLFGAHFGSHLGTHLPWDPFWGPGPFGPNCWTLGLSLIHI